MDQQSNQTLSRKDKIIAVLKELGLLNEEDLPWAIIEDTYYVLEDGALRPKHHFDEADLIAS